MTTLKYNINNTAFTQETKRFLFTSGQQTFTQEQGNALKDNISS